MANISIVDTWLIGMNGMPFPAAIILIILHITYYAPMQ